MLLERRSVYSRRYIGQLRRLASLLVGHIAPLCFLLVPGHARN